MRDTMYNQRLKSSARWYEKIWGGLCLIGVLWALTAPSAQAVSPFHEDLEIFWDAYDTFTPIVSPKLALTERAKAAIDECWDGTFQNNSLSIPFTAGSGLMVPEDIAEAACFPHPTTSPPGVPATQYVPNKKANQTYIWSMAGDGNRIIYGTGANIFCTTSGGSLGNTDPSASANNGIVCEYGASHHAVSQGGIVPDQLGDWRPPQAYFYDVVSQVLTSKTQSIIDGGCEDELHDTIGFRAAGAHKGWTFVAGSSLLGSTLTANASEKLYLFAWKPNGDFAGCHAFEQYNDGRKMRVVKNELYFGVQNTPDSCTVDPENPAAYTIGVEGDKATVTFKYESPTIYEWGYKTTNFGDFQLVSSGSSANRTFTTSTEVIFVLRDKATKQELPLAQPIIEKTYTYDGNQLIWSVSFTMPNGKTASVTIPSPSSSGGDSLASVEAQTGGIGSLGNLLGCGGSILRWTGFQSGNPFNWTVVGQTDAMVSNLADHDGRLFAITWPQLATLAGDGGMTTQTASLSGDSGGVGGGDAGLTLPDGSADLSQLILPFLGLIREVLTNPDLELGLFASLYMSPTIGPGGLTAQHKEQWQKVWQSSQYEPDLIVAMTYGGGDLRSFDGYLWWGTMHLPGLAEILFTTLHNLGLVDHDTNGDGEITGGSDEEDDVLELGTQRYTSIHRGKNFGTQNQVIQVVYGNEYLPIYDRAQKSYTFVPDAVHKNKTGQAPLFGLAGFGYSSFYTWTMEVFGGSLYIGPFAFGNNSTNPLGADLWRIDSKTSPAVAESLKVGHAGQYGVRSTAVLNNKLYLGMAGPVNLDRTHLQNPQSPVIIPKPGYQLIEGQPLP